MNLLSHHQRLHPGIRPEVSDAHGAIPHQDDVEVARVIPQLQVAAVAFGSPCVTHDATHFSDHNQAASWLRCIRGTHIFPLSPEQEPEVCSSPPSIYSCSPIRCTHLHAFSYRPPAPLIRGVGECCLAQITRTTTQRTYCLSHHHRIIRPFKSSTSVIFDPHLLAPSCVLDGSNLNHDSPTRSCCWGTLHRERASPPARQSSTCHTSSTLWPPMAPRPRPPTVQWRSPA